MRYWIVKGTAKDNGDFKDLTMNTPWTWRTKRPPKNSWEVGDRIFQWKSSPHQLVIALGKITKLPEQKDEEGNTTFDIRYLTNLFEKPVHSSILKENPIIKEASFLKSGPVQTVLSLSEEHAKELYKVVVHYNPDISSIWKDLLKEQPTLQSVTKKEQPKHTKKAKLQQDNVTPTEKIILSEEVECSNETVFNPSSLEDARKKIHSAIVLRQGQGEFRKKLIEAYNGCCAITGANAEQALEAAHIISYKGEQTNHITNGLLLRADIHTLFDLGLIAIDTKTMAVVIAPSLFNTTYKELLGKPLLLPKNKKYLPSIEALELHRRETGL